MQFKFIDLNYRDVAVNCDNQKVVRKRNRNKESFEKLKKFDNKEFRKDNATQYENQM